MHRILGETMELDAIYVCPHLDENGCDCRKPAPGLLELAARDLNVDLSRSFLIGDTWRDIGAGRAAGCRTVLIDRPYSGTVSTPSIKADYLASDVGSAVQQIISLTDGPLADGFLIDAGPPSV